MFREDDWKECEIMWALMRLFAARISGRPVLQMMVADLVRHRAPGAPGSAMFGRSKNVIEQTRGRLVRALADSADLLADATADPDQRAVLARVAEAIRGCLPCRTAGAPGRVRRLRAPEAFTSIDEALSGWIGVMKAWGACDVDFIAPGPLGEEPEARGSVNP